MTINNKYLHQVGAIMSQSGDTILRVVKADRLACEGKLANTIYLVSLGCCGAETELTHRQIRERNRPRDTEGLRPIGCRACAKNKRQKEGLAAARGRVA